MKIKQRTCKYTIKININAYDSINRTTSDIQIYGDEFDTHNDKAFMTNYQLNRCKNGYQLK